MKHKGQVFTSDAVTAAILITIALAAMTASYWSQYHDKQNREAVNMLEAKAYHATQLLGRTQGKPHQWHMSGNPLSLGVLDAYNQINLDKADALSTLSYRELKRLTGTGNHELHIQVTDDRNRLECVAGRAPTGEAAALTETIKLSDTQGDMKTLKVTVWMKKHQIRK